MHDLEPFLDVVRNQVACARIAPGGWRRWTTGSQGAAGLNPYGCADAINILATLGELPRDHQERTAAVTALQQMQDGDGSFRESTHHQLHTTAHCLAALALLDVGPAHPLTFLHELRDPAAVAPFLEALAWRTAPWAASHRGAGLYAALWLAGESSPAWEDCYFDWLAAEADPVSGYWRRGCVAPMASHGDSLMPHLAGTFHYLFNLEHARRSLPYPAALIDSCLSLRRSDPYPLGRHIGFAEIDWVYCLSRARRQSDHRWREVGQALEDFTAFYLAQLMARDHANDPELGDLHRLFGVVCCLAELQEALPGRLRSDRPLQLVLNRRPFI